MSHPLIGIGLKMVRALDQLRELHEMGTDFLSRDPYSVRFETYREQRTRERRRRAQLVIRRYPPPAFGILMGEAIYHTRGVLDHLVYQLALLNRKNPQGTQFPIHTNETVYRTAPPGKKSPRDTMLAGVREEHRAIVDEFQPYHDAPLEKRNRLHVLSQFANADKHRVIQAAYGRPSSIKVEPTADGAELDLRMPILSPPVEDGAELFSVRWIDGHADVPMKYEIGMTIAYGRGFAVFVGRHYMVETVERVNEIVNIFAERVPEFR